VAARDVDHSVGGWGLVGGCGRRHSGRVKSIIVAAALVAALLAPSARAAATAGVESWSVDLSTVDADGGNVTAVDGGLRLGAGTSRAASAAEPTGDGTLIGAPHRLSLPTDLVTATADADRPAGAEVLVDVRGKRADGTWSEWTPAGDQLDEPTQVVQPRLTLRAAATGGGPHLREITLSAAPTTTVGRSGPKDPLSFEVFATREGLVGHTTANGHVIVERDHFVALPSRRGLSSRGNGDYSVKVCAPNGRCAWAPVWDVGPWNTRDDYWNAMDIRQMWADLPHGLPQAQAAHRDGYNNGRDQYDRQVRNPAGIDLADGTFWDALQLPTNSWVTVTYLWTGTGTATATVGTVVTHGVPLNVRDGANTDHPPVGLAGNHATVHVECMLQGDPATGTQGTSDVWLRIAPGRYVAKAYVALADEASAQTCG
jgi:uncharacterized protein YraI